MTLPGAEDALAALEATWPAAEIRHEGPVRLRRGAGGGKRVSAASVGAPFGEPDIARAEALMADMGQAALFMVRPHEAALDDLLAARGYRLLDPVTLYARPARPGPPPPEAEGRTDALRSLWDTGGIGADRRAVMDRAPGPKAVLVLPGPDAPDAAVFAACGGRGAMLHALHVAPAARRRGLGRALTEGVVHWAAARGAPWVGLAVTDANAPARALYASLGFEPVGRYWYRASRG